MQKGPLTFTTDWATSATAIGRYLRVDVSSGVIVVAGAGERGYGHLDDHGVLSGQKTASVHQWNTEGTIKAVASGAITQYADVFFAAGGKYTATANGARVGKALSATSADNGIFDFLPLPMDGAGLPPLAAGSAITLTSAHFNRTIVLDTAAGSTVTLPAAIGSGGRIELVVSIKPTSNQHRINVVGNDEFVGSVNILDVDAAAQGAFAALDGVDNDRCDLNGTTKGGQVGDRIQLVDVLTDNWQISGQLVCPAGSNPATPFTTGAVS